MFAGFSLIHSKPLLRNAYLFFVSLFFYYKTSGLFLLVLLFVVTYNFFAARALRRARPGWKTFWVAISIVIDLGILAYFKYAYFLADFLNDLFGLTIEVRDVLGELGNMITGSNLFRVDAIILPVGISFFTFQAVSYIMDVKREKVEPIRNFLDFGFFLTFFPQLVAGPIVRAPEFFPQLHKPYNLSRRWFGIAIFWILNGLIKKLVLADYLAVNLSDRVFGNPLLYTGFENLAALFCYSLQVYPVALAPGLPVHPAGRQPERHLGLLHHHHRRGGHRLVPERLLVGCLCRGSHRPPAPPVCVASA